MPKFQRLQESNVAADEIDNLGHLNMRYYYVRFHKAARALLTRLGMPDAVMQSAAVTMPENISLFQGEQFLGAPVAVDGGVVAADEGGLTVYFELLNSQTGARAACSTQKLVVVSRQTRAHVPLPAPVIAAARQALVTVPAHGVARTLNFEPPSRPSLEALEALGVRSATLPTPLKPYICDAAGYLVDWTVPIDLFFYEPGLTEAERVSLFPGAREMFPRGYAWPALEKRDFIFETPRQGDRLRYYIADLKLERRTRVRRYWCYNLNDGKLLAVTDHVVIAMDLKARRSIDVPPDIRALIEPHLRPELLP